MKPCFTSSLWAAVLAVVLAYGAASMATSAAATLSEADDRIIKEAIAACKADVKAKKIRFPASRAYLRDCVTETIRNRSTKR